jgi:hypothetical protein
MSTTATVVVSAPEQRRGPEGSLHGGVRWIAKFPAASDGEAAHAHRLPARRGATLLARTLPRGDATGVVRAVVQLGKAVVALAGEIHGRSSATRSRRRLGQREARGERVALGRRTVEESRWTGAAFTGLALGVRGTDVSTFSAIVGIRCESGTRVAASLGAHAPPVLASLHGTADGLTVPARGLVGLGIDAPVSADRQQSGAPGFAFAAVAVLAGGADVSAPAAVRLGIEEVGANPVAERALGALA